MKKVTWQLPYSSKEYLEFINENMADMPLVKLITAIEKPEGEFHSCTLYLKEDDSNAIFTLGFYLGAISAAYSSEKLDVGTVEPLTQEIEVVEEKEELKEELVNIEKEEPTLKEEPKVKEETPEKPVETKVPKVVEKKKPTRASAKKGEKAPLKSETSFTGAFLDILQRWTKSSEK